MNKKTTTKKPAKEAMNEEEVTKFLNLIEELQIETIYFNLLAMRLKKFTDKLHPKSKALKFFKNLPKHIDGTAEDR